MLRSQSLRYDTTEDKAQMAKEQIILQGEYLFATSIYALRTPLKMHFKFEIQKATVSSLIIGNAPMPRNCFERATFAKQQNKQDKKISDQEISKPIVQTALSRINLTQNS